MSESRSLKIPKWDQSIPDFLALRKLVAQFETFAIQLTGPKTADRQGLRWALFSAVRFQNATGNARIIIVDPGAFGAGMAGGALENHKAETKLFECQETNLPVLANAFESALPDRIRKIIEVNFSLDHLTLQEQIEALEAALPPKEADLDYLRNQIAAPFTSAVQIESHTQMQIQNLAHLAAAGQPIPPMDAVRRMWLSYTATAIDVEDFAQAKTQYLVLHGALGQQTPATLSAFLIDFVSNQLAHHRSANQALRAVRSHAHAAVAASAIAPVVQVIHPLAPPPPVAAPAVAVAVAQHQPGHGGRGGRGGRGGAGAPLGPPPVPLQGTPGFYCWTHGTCYHYSLTCKKPAAAHRWDATLANRLGGAP